MESINPTPSKRKIPVFSNPVALVFVLSVLVGVLFLYSIFRDQLAKLPTKLPGNTNQTSTDVSVKTFTSEEDFQEYIDKYSENTYFSGFGSLSRTEISATRESFDNSINLNAPTGLGGGGSEKVDRYSETNVQVKGIDEPDIVKTDGKSIFHAGTYYNIYPVDLPTVNFDVSTGLEKMIAPAPRAQKTRVVSALPASNMKELPAIPESGELLYVDGKLVVFSNQLIKAYDVSDPENASVSWELALDSKQSLVTSRLVGKTIYVVSSSYVERSDPCPIAVLENVNGNGLVVPCDEIYHPVRPVSVDSTFTVFSIDATNGKVKDKVSFVGSSYGSTIYMSRGNLYIGYSYTESVSKFMYKFLLSEGVGIFPQEVIARLEEINVYNISDNSKLQEFQLELEKYLATLDSDDAKKLQNDMQDKAQKYLKEHARELERTGLVRIDLVNLDVAATGYVPGTLLNQLSMDEYSEHLRVATTIGDSWIGGVRSETFNDVYVLDSDLKQTGKIENLGVTERIYSARFVGEKGYLVTFRQIDPFYVLDLSDPVNPHMAGELKIPGYSSYLHPVGKDRVLGVGMDGSFVKASLFDVSDPTRPTQKDTYALTEYWTEIQNNYHAFLMDEKFGVFFIPGSSGGYVFSYEGDHLVLVKAISDIQAKRALFINDNLYIVGEEKIVVYDENTWQKVGELNYSELN